MARVVLRYVEKLCSFCLSSFGDRDPHLIPEFSGET